MNKLSFVTKKIKLLVLLVAVAVTIFSYFGGSASALTCRITSGHTVKQVQSALNSKGGYGLSVDGVMGSKTCSAITSFQKSRGLTVDGIVGPATAKALGLTSSSTSLKCNYGATSCFIAVKGKNYQGNVYVIHNSQIKATYEAVFGGSGHATPNGTFNIYFSRAYAHTSTKYPSSRPNMNYPVYFKHASSSEDGDIAIHGSHSVPDSAGSHGCVRVRWDNGPKVYNWYRTYGITQVIVK